VKKNRRGETIWVIIQTHMEMSWDNVLNHYLKQTKMSFFPFYRIGEQEGRRGLVWGVGTSSRRKDVRKGCRRVKVAPILGIHVCKWKTETC
jgi:hypothetical protein